MDQDPSGVGVTHHMCNSATCGVVSTSGCPTDWRCRAQTVAACDYTIHEYSKPCDPGHTGCAGVMCAEQCSVWGPGQATHRQAGIPPDVNPIAGSHQNHGTRTVTGASAVYIHTHSNENSWSIPPSHPSAADEAWYWPKRVLHIG